MTGEWTFEAALGAENGETKMRDVRIAGFQGDMMLRRVEVLPPGLSAAAPTAGRHVLAHSETGHHHDVAAGGLKLMTGDDPMVAYLVMESVEHADIVHHRSLDTHETIRLLGEPGAVFEVRRQREYTPEGWRRVED